jgi:hypothetical protein
VKKHIKPVLLISAKVGDESLSIAQRKNLELSVFYL